MSKEEKCPNCGYCPACGRSNSLGVVVYPGTAWPYPWPWTTTPYYGNVSLTNVAAGVGGNTATYMVNVNSGVN